MKRSIYSALLAALVLALALQACSSAPKKNDAATPASCPDQKLGETGFDCPWAGIARALHSNATPELLSRAAPELSSQVKLDGKNDALKELWGKSTNYDELAKAGIIDPTILTALADFFGVSTDTKTAHAGLEHTYGYLFSNLQTPFGYKRARWVRNILERGFGIPNGLLGPTPAVGTLLSNVTAFFGKIAFRGEDDAEARAKLEKATSGVPTVIRAYPLSSLNLNRLEETIQIGKRKVILRTDLVDFPYPIEFEKNSVLLVYSVRDGDDSRLITGFPVEASFKTLVSDPKNLGPKKPIHTRYNAYVDGITGQEFQGQRRIVPEAK